MKVVVVSGYFNPLHGGHLDMIEAAKKLGDYLVVVVNNDEQAIMKKGKIILNEQNRLRLMRALRDVDRAMLSVDTNDTSQTETLKLIRANFPKEKIIFANGGDRSEGQSLPKNEYAICKKLGIEMIFGVGSELVEKRDSSTRIIEELGRGV